MSAQEIRAWGLAALAGVLAFAVSLISASVIREIPSVAPEQGEASTPFAEVMTTPELVQAGRDSFVMSCVECHGDDAHGDEGPDLHNLAISNARIATTIKKGVRGEMPAFAKKYDDAHIVELLAYLRSLH